MRKTISQVGIDLIKSFEGCSLIAYKPVANEVYFTIGWGHYGSDVYEDMTITQEQADWLLQNDLKEYEDKVNTVYYVPVTDQLNQNQFDALVSFCYNCGCGNLKSLCDGKTVEQIGNDLLLYNHGANGQVLDGLVRRRKAEQELYNKKDVLEMEDWAIDFIVDVMKDYWNRMQGNQEVQDATHKALNELRKATGRPEE